MTATASTPPSARRTTGRDRHGDHQVAADAHAVRGQYAHQLAHHGDRACRARRACPHVGIGGQRTDPA
jgi:hypothetical protein